MGDQRYRDKNQTGGNKDESSSRSASIASTFSISTSTTSFSNSNSTSTYFSKSNSTSSTSFSSSINTSFPSATSFTSSLVLLGSGGRVTVGPVGSRAGVDRVDPSQGPVNWDSLVDKVFTEEIAKYF